MLTYNFGTTVGTNTGGAADSVTAATVASPIGYVVHQAWLTNGKWM